MSTLKCSCNGRLHLQYMQDNINRGGNKYVINNLPKLVCSKCNKSDWAYQVREMCEFIIDKCFIEEKGKGKTFNLDFNKIKFKFCVDKFISTKVGFLYDRDDYYFLPGLIREWEKGFLTPIFFNIEVLLKYMHHPKYSVDLGADTYGNIYTDNKHMIVFGINENNKIIMWLGDINKLSIEEQYYLRSENVPSDHNISSEFYEGQIECKWAEPSITNRLFTKRLQFNEKVMENYKVKITQLDTETIELVKNIHKPIVNTESEFADIIIAMNKLFVEAISTKEIKNYLKKNHSDVDVKDKKGIKIYQEWLNIYINNVDINKYICPLYVLYDLRVAMAHLQSIESKEKLLKDCCKRLELNENERNYSIIFNALVNKLIKMYELYLENLKIKENNNGI
ncbi:MAG: hypothetical protein SO136_02675 [Sarcina ventriculi]|uniref:hypothetical protein n=1 Tax=Sarcina ventriculi TaxID=1267 RepID=UPI001C0F9862|nr:hypothetical protein [Sarcina ventriculi]MBU5322419.1 hypothetical protein [Sarcina ventriculi]MCI5637089.1 hypothetical protein [Sarcina ventriculi]MDD7374332.1 hypothetical protein [Sarcina ventriculi]MDY7061799.1 hypothetical protein [Sarcina ventriculi]